MKSVTKKAERINNNNIMLKIAAVFIAGTYMACRCKLK